MIQLHDVSFGYTQDRLLFENFDWQVEKGEAWTVLGPSGCGKSTLLYLLAGLRFPLGGEVLIDGQLITRPRPHTGLILQDFGLLPWATVEENASLGLEIRGFYGPDGKHTPPDFQKNGQAKPWLERLGLSEVSRHYPSQISGGQRQRTAIARTLVLNPDLLLMDEPFSSLDAPTREGLQNLTLELQAEQHLTLVMVTHWIEEAAFMGRKILLLNRPPNQAALVIENPDAGKPEFRQSAGYQALCSQLRARMEI